jgi:hypothetical protein
LLDIQWYHYLVSLRGVRVAQIPETGGVDMFIEQNDDCCARRRGLSRYDEGTVMSFGDFSVPGLFFRAVCREAACQGRLVGTGASKWRTVTPFTNAHLSNTSAGFSL